jgi:hypothetical protein
MRTWRDAVELVLDVVGGQKTGGRNLALAKVAVQEAIQSLVDMRDWNYYIDPARIVTVDQYATGTVEYDHTGNVSGERLVTLTGGTFPAWAERGTLLIGSVPYRVSTRESDTELILDETVNPQADVAAGSTYTLYQEAFILPAGFKRPIRVDRLNNWDGQYLSPQAFQNARESLEFSGQPRYWTIMTDPKDTRRQAMWFYPAPQSEESFDLLFERRPVPLSVYDYKTGTVTVSLGGRSVTGSGTVFSSGMVGAVIRFGTAAKTPESLESVENQYAHESIISARTSDTAVTLATNADQASTAVKHRISSRIDVADSMWNAMISNARWRYMRLTASPASQQAAAADLFGLDLELAAGADQNSPRGNSGAVDPFSAARTFEQVSYQ